MAASKRTATKAAKVTTERQRVIRAAVENDERDAPAKDAAEHERQEAARCNISTSPAANSRSTRATGETGASYVSGAVLPVMGGPTS